MEIFTIQAAMADFPFHSEIRELGSAACFDRYIFAGYSFTIGRDFLGEVFHLKDFKGYRWFRRLVVLFISEFLGTAILEFIGCGSITRFFLGSTPTLLDICVAFGFAVTTSVMIFGHISGSHINPAVSIAYVITGHMSLALFILYSAAQVTGALAGFETLMYLTPHNAVPIADNMTNLQAEAYCVTSPHKFLNVRQATLAEAVATGILILAACAAWDPRNADKHDSIPIKFGVIVTSLAISTALFGGCSLNPARSFAPAFYTNYWKNHWVYWVGPMSGAIVAATIYRLVFDPSYTEMAITDRHHKRHKMKQNSTPPSGKEKN